MIVCSLHRPGGGPRCHDGGPGEERGESAESYFDRATATDQGGGGGGCTFSFPSTCLDWQFYQYYPPINLAYKATNMSRL